MGGCATKPKVLKADQEGEVPEPVPEPVKEEAAAATVSEAKEVVVVDNQEGDKKVDGDEVAKVKEIVEDGKADDQESKPRSLSNLFKTEEGQDSTPVDNAPSEPVKEESKETEKPKEVTETKQPDVEKSEISVEQTPASEFVDAPEKPDTEKTTDVTPVTKTEAKESSEKKIVDIESSENKSKEVKSSEQKTEEAKSPEIKTEDAKSSDEKKIEEAK